jgi:transcriptional regulator with XRE-family HTH domain
MTHFQDLFIRNLRYYRTQRGYNQFQFSIMIDLSPNYLNAVENGKNFPSPEVIQRMVTVLDILPYQLFLEHPVDTSPQPQHILKDAEKIIQSLTSMKQEFVQKFDAVITQLKT